MNNKKTEFMKKNIIIILLIVISMQLSAQEKGSYLTISGGAGPSGIKYEWVNVNFADPKCELKNGGHATLGYSYFFTKHIGLSLGLGMANYKTHGKLMGDFSQQHPFVLGNYKDNDWGTHVKDYELRVRTKDWEEYQSVRLLEIPLMVNLQKKFGEKEYFGLYLNAGAKFQIPVNARYAIYDGKHTDDPKLNVSGYNKEKDLELGGLGSPDLSQHGFGQIYNPSERLTNANGKLNMKLNISLVGEAGVLISLSRRVDLSLGAFIDYGLLDMRKEKKSTPIFTCSETDYVAGAQNNNVGKGITYNSITQSQYVNKVSSISYGAKAGLRVKLGKLSQKESAQQQPQQQPIAHDTVYLNTKQQNNDSILNKVMNKLDSILENKAIIHSQEIKTAYDEQLDFHKGVYPDEEMNILFDAIYFDLNQSFLRPASVMNLDEKAKILKKYPEIKLLIFGQTCDIGNDAYNFKLGFKRAEVTKKYLVEKGIDGSRLQISTMSSFEPELPNTSEQNRTYNRRADFKPIFPRKH